MKKTGEDLLFLHRIHTRGASRSYGIGSVGLVSATKPVVQRAHQVLDQQAE